MRSQTLSGVAIAVVMGVAAGFAGEALAVDMAVKAPPPVAPPWNWAGFYIGAHVGSGMALSNVNDPSGPSIFGDGVHSPGFFGGGQVGYNWQAPGSSLVWGIEADASLADFDGTNTCYAVSGTFTSFNCRTHTDAFGTAAGRVGWAFGPSGRALAYAKGGLAWEHGSENIVANDSLAPGISGGTSNTTLASVGWTVGAGVEYALTPHWSVKAEYDFLDFGGMDAFPRSGLSPRTSARSTNTATARVRLRARRLRCEPRGSARVRSSTPWFSVKTTNGSRSASAATPKSC